MAAGFTLKKKVLKDLKDSILKDFLNQDYRKSIIFI